MPTGDDRGGKADCGDNRHGKERHPLLWWVYETGDVFRIVGPRLPRGTPLSSGLQDSIHGNRRGKDPRRGVRSVRPRRPIWDHASRPGGGFSYAGMKVRLGMDTNDTATPPPEFATARRA